ncbi:hypothetical protein, partial [Paenibacillus sp. FSL R5-808]
AVIIIPGISATTAIEGTIRPRSGLPHLYLPHPHGGRLFGAVWTHADQRRGRIDSGKAVAVG